MHCFSFPAMFQLATAMTFRFSTMFQSQPRVSAACFSHSHVFQQHVSVTATCFRFPEERALNYGSSLSSKPANRWLKFSISAETSETSAATYETSAATYRTQLQLSDLQLKLPKPQLKLTELQPHFRNFSCNQRNFSQILKIITLIFIANFNGQIYSLKLKL